MKRLQWSALMTALVLAGCASVGPDYKPAAPSTPTLANLDAQRESAAQFQAQWWKQFGDPTLDALIQRAAQRNLDLRIALAHLNESRALLSDTKADHLPTINAGTSYSRSLEQYPGFTVGRIPINTYRSGFDASWEVDVFGGVRREVEAASAELGAREAELQDVQVSLIAEVARNYFELRGTQQRQAIAQRNIENLRDTVHLTQVQRSVGTGSEQDVASASAQLSAVEAQLPLLDMQLHASEYRLAVLLGERPGELEIDLSPQSFTPIATSLPIGDAGDVLSRRPDVRVAERQLAAATARIGVAKADFFPHVSLGGFIGFLSGRSNDFGGPITRAWSLSPSITWSGLNVQRVRAQLHAAQAQTDAAQANYDQAILLAVEDVDNAITGYNDEHRRVDKLIERSAQSERAASLAQVRYKEGATGFLELLDAQRIQLAADDDLAQAEAAINTRAVTLYKALGGGWQACGDVVCHGLAKVP
ncbi:MAG: efflux transporter outer membrane subunit [Dyella sp.]